MIISIVQAKHGQGCSTVAAGLAAAAAAMGTSKVLLVAPSVDDSDLPAILGMATPHPGTIMPATEMLDFLHGITPDSYPLLATYSLVIIDDGLDYTELPNRIDLMLQVVQTAYLPLRRTVGAELDAPFIEVTLPGAALSTRDIERALGSNHVASIPFSPHIARAVDAGLLASRCLAEFVQAWLAVVAYLTDHPITPTPDVHVLNEDAAQRADVWNEARQIDIDHQDSEN